MPKLKVGLSQKRKVTVSPKQTYIGIDNGLTGGAVVLQDRKILGKLVTPTMAKEKGNEIDILTLSDWLEEYVTDSTSFIIERPGGSKSYNAAVSMANTIGQLTALMRLKYWRFILITPKRWQKVMLPNCKAEQTKKFALSVARNLWPKEDWLATPRCRTPHEGLIDAALIAEFAKRNRLF